jgi:pyruvate,water dikinase
MVLWFSDLSKDDVPIAGGKGANLGELVRAGLPIPPGFVITSEIFNSFLEKSNLSKKIKKILDDTDVDNSRELQRSSKKIRELIRKAEVPEDIKKDILANYKKLCGSEDGISLVAIRSSATAEDLPGASFAGQQETFLNVGEDEVVEKVKECWSSLYTPRAIFYREKKGFEHEKVSIAVVVQRMVDSEKSGVLFTVHPATGEKDKMIIEAAWGLGEGVVSGAVTPDHYVVAKKTGELLDKEIARKEVMFVRNSRTGGTVKKPVPEDMAEKQVLEEDEIKRLTQLGKLVEEHYDFPQDIEWAIDGGELYLLQSRPITVLYGEEKEKEKKEEKKDIILKGLAASPGIGAGKVKIIYTTDELDKVQEGDILVTTMTNPDMVPAMRRANAIVTEEGGMTCIGAGAQLLTQKGFMPIEEVYAGVRRGENLEVLSLDTQSLKLRWRKVINSMRRKSLAYKLEVYEHTELGDTIWITPDHKMITLNGKGDLELLELQDVLKRERTLLAASKVPEYDIAYDAVAEGQFYLAGILGADGAAALGAGKPAGRLFQKHYGSEHGDFSHHEDISHKAHPRGRVSEPSRSREKPAEFLLNFKEEGDRIILRSNEGEVLNYLAGYVDGDGHVTRNGWIEICGSGDDPKALVLACLRVGVRPCVRFRKNAWVLVIPNSPLVEQILDKTRRVRGVKKQRADVARKFAARDLVGEIEGVDHGDRLYGYIRRNTLVDVERLYSYLRDEKSKAIAKKFMGSELSSVRVRHLAEDVIDVYNITVDAEREIDHNYVVFTKGYTPLVVGNCHAAIVSRELGIPCVVGTLKATKVLKDGDEVTVDGSKGVVYRGLLVEEKEKAKEAPVEVRTRVITATEIKVNISIPEVAPRVAPLADGVGLLRVEHMLLGIGKHPIKFIQEGKEDELIEKLADGVRKVAEAFYPKPVWYRSLDAPTDEFRSLKGGEDEPVEHNPMLGWRGIRRGLDQEELLRAEFKAIKKLVEEGYTNIGTMIPLVIRPEELRRAKEIAMEVGLKPHVDVKFGIMVETPASALIIEDFIEEGLDFISFGTNDLTQYTLAIDRNNERVAKLFSEKHEAVMKLIEMVIKKCRDAGVETSICGQAGSYPDVVDKLVRFGISSVSANPDAIEVVRETVARTEKRLLLDKARSG